MNYLGIDRENLTKLVEEMNTLLSNYHVYYQNLRNFHWNVQGENFFDLHAEFEVRYNDARQKIDEIAERILTLRFRPVSNMSDYLSKSAVEEAGMVEKDSEMVSLLLTNHTTLIDNMRRVIDAAQAVEDEGTIDLIGAYIRELEKSSWMFNAWLSRKREKATSG